MLVPRDHAVSLGSIEVRIDFRWSLCNQQCAVGEPIDGSAVTGVTRFDDKILHDEITVAFQSRIRRQIIGLDDLIRIDAKCIGFMSFGRTRSFLLGAGRLCGRRLEKTAGFDLGTPGGFLEALDLVAQFLDLTILFLDDAEQRQYQWRLLGHWNVNATDLQGLHGFLLFLRTHP